MDHLWRDYGSLVAPAATIINEFIAVVIAQFFKDHPIAKVILVCAAAIFGAAAIRTTFYSQHKVVVAKAIEDSRRFMIREKIGEFISEGNSTMYECRLRAEPIPKDTAYK